MTPMRVGSLRRKPVGELARDALDQAAMFPDPVAVTMAGTEVWLESPDEAKREIIMVVSRRTDPDVLAENIRSQVYGQ